MAKTEKEQEYALVLFLYKQILNYSNTLQKLLIENKTKVINQK